jgi:hypothetical protein
MEAEIADAPEALEAPDLPLEAPPPIPDSPSTIPILPAVETDIEINKGNSGLGLSIVGGSDTLLGVIIIHEVYEEGAAFQDGRLQSGEGRDKKRWNPINGFNGITPPYSSSRLIEVNSIIRGMLNG